MSELYAQTPETKVSMASASRQQEPVRAPNDSTQTRIQTPREIMAARNAREARRAQLEARQRQGQGQQDQIQDPDQARRADNVVGVGLDPRHQQGYTQSQFARPDADARIPAGQSVTIGGRTETIPTSNGIATRPSNTVASPGQSRPMPSQMQQPQPQQQQYSATDASRVQRNRTEAYERLDMPPAIANTNISAPATSAPQQAGGYALPTLAQSQAESSRSTFPHAFERWETLSSHWEGLTSFWIRKLEENTAELDSKPIDKQMSRQITDLSAAGANLFHAVVELQRLRASSERKFQRWFNDTKQEQGQLREEVGRLRAQLEQEKQKPPQISNANVDAVVAEKNKADELVREMRRELQISKEEARRAWEELGRREQEERERTIALRSGEPTLIGGVQVLPMQGLSSRHNTAASQRPVTRDGPYAGGPTATMMGGQQPAQSTSQTTLDSPANEQAQFNYEINATSPTDTDPFTETARPLEPPVPLRHEPDTRFVSSGSPAPRYPAASQTMNAARAAVTSPAQSQRSTQGPSYIPSTRSGGGSVQSEEEYHIGPDGQYIRDPQGRRIPYRQPIGGYEEVDSDDDDHTDDVIRERMLAEEYARRQEASRHASPGQPHQAQSHSPSRTAASAYAATTTPQAPQGAFEASPADSRFTGSSTVSPVTPQQVMSARVTSPLRDPADYEGAGYGEPEPLYPPPTTAPGGSLSATNAADPSYAPTHHNPTRLSDIPEERTETSRSSAFSAEQHPFGEPQGGLFGTRR